jgi:hypothetical protein
MDIYYNKTLLIQVSSPYIIFSLGKSGNPVSSSAVPPPPPTPKYPNIAELVFVVVLRGDKSIPGID